MSHTYWIPSNPPDFRKGSWLPQALKKLTFLANVTDERLKLSREMCLAGWQVLCCLSHESEPCILPMPEGTLLFEWDRITIEVLTPGLIECRLSGRSDTLQIKKWDPFETLWEWFLETEHGDLSG